jgi:UPF0716 protein FxsA
MPLLILVFIVVPLVELYVIIQVGQAIGVGPTIGLLLLDSILGAVLLRAQGRSAWRRFQAAVQAGRAPAREVLDGVLVIFGAAFLLTPGFVTDIIGLALLVPFTRALFRRVLIARFVPRMVRVGAAGVATRVRRPAPADVEGTAVDVDDPSERRLP